MGMFWNGTATRNRMRDGKTNVYARLDYLYSRAKVDAGWKLLMGGEINFTWTSS